MQLLDHPFGDYRFATGIGRLGFNSTRYLTTEEVFLDAAALAAAGDVHGNDIFRCGLSCLRHPL